MNLHLNWTWIWYIFLPNSTLNLIVFSCLSFQSLMEICHLLRTWHSHIINGNPTAFQKNDCHLVNKCSHFIIHIKMQKWATYCIHFCKFNIIAREQRKWITSKIRSFHIKSTSESPVNTANLVCSVSGCKIAPIDTPPISINSGHRQGMFRFVSASLKAHKHLVLSPLSSSVILPYLHPHCQIAPPLPYPVANNIPLFCPQLSPAPHTLTLWAQTALLSCFITSPSSFKLWCALLEKKNVNLNACF